MHPLLLRKLDPTSTVKLAHGAEVDDIWGVGTDFAVWVLVYFRRVAKIGRTDAEAAATPPSAKEALNQVKNSNHLNKQ